MEPGKDSSAGAKLSWSWEMWSKEEKRCCNHVESKGEVTDYKYCSFRIVLKPLGRILSKNPYSCLPCINSHILNVFTSAKGICMLSTQSSSSPLPPTIFQLSHCRVEISVIGPVSKGSRVSRCPRASAQLGHCTFPREVTPTKGLWAPPRFSVCWDVASAIILYTRLSVQKQL